MLFFVFFVTALLSSGIIESMETYKSGINCMQVAPWNEHRPEDYFANSAIVMKQDNKKTKRYEVHGVDTIIIDGGNRGEGKDTQYGHVQVKFTQKSDCDLSEEMVICADKKAFPYIIVNHNGPHLEIKLRPELQKVDLFKDIAIVVALKKYAKIVTNNYVTTTFFSPIKAEKLHIALMSGATMHIPCVEAKTIELLVKGDSVVKMHDKARLKAEDLLFIYREGLAEIMLDLETKFLQAQSNGAGKMVLKGDALRQELRFLEGSFCGFDLHSEHILIDMVEGSGKIRLSAEKSIKGFKSLTKSNYDVRYRTPNDYDVCIYPAEKELRYPI